MSNEPRWLTDIDRKIGKLICQHNDLIRDYRRALEHEHELEEQVKNLEKQLAKHEPQTRYSGITPEEHARIQAQLAHEVSGAPSKPFSGKGKQRKEP